MALVCGPLAASAGPVDSGHVRAVLTFVGDSNESLTATSIELTLGDGDQPYASVFLSRPGAVIRTGDCSKGTVCATHDFWRRRIGDAGEKIESDGFVVNLGINDTLTPGSPTGPGYAQYGVKIDWLMPLFEGKPVWWTNLPCSIEPARNATGCRVVNTSLAAARGRWPNLVIIDWAAAARGHRGFLLNGADRLHLSGYGQGKWCQLVKQAVDGYFVA
jgi:hypothetical protein